MKRFRVFQGRRVWDAPASGREVRFIAREIFQRHCYEQHGVAVSDGDVIFDVGANVGIFALSLMERFRGLRIFCFEPVPGNCACLERNLGESPGRADNKVTVLNLALGARDGEMSIEYYPQAPGNSTLYPDDKRREFQAIVEGLPLADSWKADKLNTLLYLPVFLFRKRLGGFFIRRVLADSVLIPCPVRTVSGMIREHRVERIDLLKIDVEGSEMDVLEGIEESHWPLIRQIAMEVAPANKPRVAALRERLSSLGFAHFALESELGGMSNPNDPLSCIVFAVRAAPQP